MSLIPTYAPPDNLPVPLTYGGIQSYTDVYGDVWVALVGVNGGQWRRARKVLFSKVCRVNPINAAVAATTIPMDLVIKDVYGLYNLSFQGGLGAFIIPVPGWYKVVLEVGVTTTAAAQYMDARIYVNGALVDIARFHSTLASSLSGTVMHQSFYNAGDYIQPSCNGSVSLAALVGPPPPTQWYGPPYWTYLTLQYKGTG
jgi:hypothetical protein